MIVTPRKAWNGSVMRVSSTRNGWLTRPGTGSIPMSGQKKSVPTSTRWTCIIWWTNAEARLASYQELK